VFIFLKKQKKKNKKKKGKNYLFNYPFFLLFTSKRFFEINDNNVRLQQGKNRQTNDNHGYYRYMHNIGAI